MIKVDKNRLIIIAIPIKMPTHSTNPIDRMWWTDIHSDKFAHDVRWWYVLNYWNNSSRFLTWIYDND